MDSYEGFAQRYDFSFGQFGTNDQQMVEFFRQLFAQNKVNTVLDCACGTGRHLPLFCSLSSRVIGSDVSEAMLRQAKINLIEVGLDVPLYQVDFRDLPSQFEATFDVVVCLGAIGFMSTETEFLNAFKSMWQVLRPSGILILNAIPTDCQWKEKPRFVLNSNSPDFSRLFAIDYLDNKARYNILDIFHSHEKSALEVWSAELHVLLRDDQERMLRAAGFRKADFYASFDFSPFDKETSNSLITIAYK